MLLGQFFIKRQLDLDGSLLHPGQLCADRAHGCLPGKTPGDAIAEIRRGATLPSASTIALLGLPRDGTERVARLACARTVDKLNS